MKKMYFYPILVVVVSLISGTAIAQNDLRVPLSNPGKAGSLIINAVFSDEIVVRAHQENDVIVRYDGNKKTDQRDTSRNGMRRISSGGVGLEVTENNNEVIVKTGPMPSDLELVVFVPQNFSLKLNATQGDVQIDGLEGELEINSVNGDIELTNISGSVLVNSVNGDIEVDFVRIRENVPMSFTGVNGDIEVAFPANAKFSAKMKTEWGDVYTNFDMAIDRSSSATEVNNSNSNNKIRNNEKYKVTVNKWVLGEVNGGGPEFLFKTLHGDISIRKK
ncbi:MAG: DUF4097 family beta strand repeat-containing protein [Balneolaceae bacterium]